MIAAVLSVVVPAATIGAATMANRMETGQCHHRQQHDDPIGMLLYGEMCFLSIGDGIIEQVGESATKGDQAERVGQASFRLKPDSMTRVRKIVADAL